MESTIRISSEGGRQPGTGIVGAIGGTTPGAAQAIEVDLREASGGDIAANLPIIAEAYRTAFFGERTLTEEVTEIPFPEAGDAHPFGDRDVEGLRQGETGGLIFHPGGYRVIGAITRDQILSYLNDRDTFARDSGPYFDGSTGPVTNIWTGASQGGTLLGTIVNTVEEWNALPKGTVMVDRDGDPHQADGGGRTLPLRYTPYKVVYLPEGEVQ